jgi:hypothetical protein
MRIDRSRAPRPSWTFGAGRLVFDVVQPVEQLLDPLRSIGVLAEVGGKPLVQVLRLADVEQVCLVIEEAIGPRRARDRAQEGTVELVTRPVDRLRAPPRARQPQAVQRFVLAPQRLEAGVERVGMVDRVVRGAPDESQPGHQILEIVRGGQPQPHLGQPSDRDRRIDRLAEPAL